MPFFVFNKINKKSLWWIREKKAKLRSVKDVLVISDSSQDKYMVVQRTNFGYNECVVIEMRLIEEFHHALNQSIKQLDFTQNYRDKVDAIIKMELLSLKQNNLAIILGAGRCNDFSLSLFLGEMKQLVLSDVDRKSIFECAKKYPSVKFSDEEYTGFASINFFENFGRRMWAIKDKDGIRKYVDEVSRAVENYQFLTEYKKRADFILVSPIYSQLVYHQIQLELAGLVNDGYSKKLANEFAMLFLQKMTDIIDRFNKNVVELLNDDGKLVVFADVFQMQKGEPFYTKVKNAINRKDIMDEIHNGYQKKYGYGLGDYGLLSMDEYIHKVKSRWLLWDFDEQRSFAVLCHIYNKKDTVEGGTL